MRPSTVQLFRYYLEIFNFIDRFNVNKKFPLVAERVIHYNKSTGRMKLKLSICYEVFQKVVSVSIFMVLYFLIFVRKAAAVIQGTCIASVHISSLSL